MEGVSRRESVVSDDDTTGFVEQEETSSMENVEWTDEKHSLYLKSMEASFVDQLYNLKEFFSCCPSNQQGSPSGSIQVKIQQQCHRAKTLRKTDPQPTVVDGSRKFLANPWSKYSKSGGSDDVAPDNDAFEPSSFGNVSGLFTDAKHHQVALDTNEECSAQNFNDEDYENKASRRQRGKRLKAQDTSDEINNDQVVPFVISCLPMQSEQATKTGSAF